MIDIKNATASNEMNVTLNYQEQQELAQHESDQGLEQIRLSNGANSFASTCLKPKSSHGANSDYQLHALMTSADHHRNFIVMKTDKSNLDGIQGIDHIDFSSLELVTGPLEPPIIEAKEDKKDDDLIVLKSSVQSPAVSRNAAAQQQDTILDNTMDQMSFLYDPQHNLNMNQSSGIYHTPQLKDEASKVEKQYQNDPNIKELHENTLIMRQMMDGSMNAHSSSKIASDTASSALPKHANKNLLSRNKIGDQTALGSLRHNVLVPSTHKLDIIESQSLSSSNFSIRKNSNPSKKMTKLRSKQGTIPKNKEDSAERKRFNQQTLAHTSIKQNGVDVSISSDTDHNQFNSLIVLGSSNRQQSKLDEVNQNSSDTKDQFLQRKSYEHQYKEIILNVEKANGPTSSHFSSVKRGQEIVIQADNVRQTMPTSSESQRTSQTFNKKGSIGDKTESGTTEFIAIHTPKVIPEDQPNMEQKEIVTMIQIIDKLNQESQKAAAIKKQKSNTISFGRTSPPINSAFDLARAQGAHLTKKNRAYFITKSNVQPPPAEETNEMSTQTQTMVKKVSNQNIEESKKYQKSLTSVQNETKIKKNLTKSMMEMSKESRVLKFLKTGGFDLKSQKSIEAIKVIFGGQHAESRALLEDLSAELLKSKVSVSDEDAVQLSKNSKNLPIFFNVKYHVDQKVEQESQMNPVLVKPKPLGLPVKIRNQVEQRRLTRQEQLQTSSETSIMTLGLAKTQSNDDILLSLKKLHNRDSRLNLKMSAKSDIRRQTEQFNEYTQTKLMKTPILSGQRRLEASSGTSLKSNQKQKQLEQLRQSFQEKGLIDLRELRSIEETLSKIEGLDQRKMKAQLNLYNNQFKQEESRKKIVEEMKECRIVQNQLRATSQELNIGNFDKRDSTSPNRSESLSLKNTSKKSLPIASSAIIPNLEVRNNIVELLHRDVNQFGTSIKQISAVRRVRSLAKQHGLNSAKREKIAATTAQSLLDVSPHKDSRLARLDSAQRRRALVLMNEKIKFKNMQKIYRLKGLSPLDDKKAHSSQKKSQERSTKMDFKNQKPQQKGFHSSKNTSMQLVPVPFDRNSQRLNPSEYMLRPQFAEEEEKISLFGDNQAYSLHNHSSEQQNNHLPQIQISQNLSPQTTIQDDVPHNIEESSATSAVIKDITLQVNSYRDSSDGCQGQTHIMTAIMSENNQEDFSEEEHQMTSIEPQNQFSLADLVQKQAQQIYYQHSSFDQYATTKQIEKVKPTNRKKVTQLEPKGTSSARFLDSTAVNDSDVGLASSSFKVQGRSSGIFNRLDSKEQRSVRKQVCMNHQNTSSMESVIASRNLPLVCTTNAASQQLAIPYKKRQMMMAKLAETRSSSVAGRNQTDDLYHLSNQRSMLPNLSQLHQQQSVQQHHPYQSSKAETYQNGNSRDYVAKFSNQAFHSAMSSKKKINQASQTALRKSQTLSKKAIIAQLEFESMQQKAGATLKLLESSTEGDDYLHIEKGHQTQNSQETDTVEDEAKLPRQSEFEPASSTLPQLSKVITRNSDLGVEERQSSFERMKVANPPLTTYLSGIGKTNQEQKMMTLNNEKNDPRASQISKLKHKDTRTGTQSLLNKNIGPDIVTARTTNLKRPRHGTPERLLQSSVSSVNVSVEGIHCRNTSLVSSSDYSGQPMHLIGQKYTPTHPDSQSSLQPIKQRQSQMVMNFDLIKTNILTQSRSKLKPVISCEDSNQKFSSTEQSITIDDLQIETKFQSKYN